LRERERERERERGEKKIKERREASSFNAVVKDLYSIFGLYSDKRFREKRRGVQI